jgi:Protein of unknown function (DUF3999)
MKLIAASLLLVATAPEIQYFQFKRPVVRQSQQTAQACAVVGPDIFANSTAELADLRLYHDTVETPYVIRIATPVQSAQTTITPLNLGLRGGKTVFDAAIAEGRYNDLDLTVAANDFIATVVVSGGNTEAENDRTKLGSYTIFDLTGQKLGRSTVLHLPESSFRYLHFEISGPLTPKDITGLTIARLPTRESKYVTVAESSHVTQDGHSTVLEFVVPPHIPVDRVLFTPGSRPALFSRKVTVAVTPQSPPSSDGRAEAVSPITFTGGLLRVHSTENGHRINEERLSVNTISILDGHLNIPAKWAITIDNGDDPPISLGIVRLQMLQRDLCFEADAAASYTLFYGDSALQRPVYDYETLFAAQTDAAKAVFGAEQHNPMYRARPDQRPFTEKHPVLLWVALVVVIPLLAVIALRSAKATSPQASA